MSATESNVTTFPTRKKEVSTVAVARPRKAAAPKFGSIKEWTPVLLGATALVGGLFPFERRFLWTEASYLATAENLFSHSPYYSEAGSRPLLLPLLLHAGSRVMSLDIFARVLATMFFAAAVVLLYLLGRKLYGYGAGLCAAVLMILSPYFVFWSHKVMADIPATALLLASMYLLFLHLEGNDKFWWRALLSGALLAAAFMTQWMTALAVIVALYFVAIRRLRLPALGYGLACLAALAPYLIWNKVKLGTFVWPVWSALASEFGTEPTPDRIYYLKAVFIVVGPLALFGVLGYLYMLMTKQADSGEGQASSVLAGRFFSKDLALILWLLIFVALLSLAPHKDAAYILPAMPALYLLAGRGCSGMRSNALGSVALLAVPIALFYTATHLPYFQAHEKWMDVMLQYSGETREAGMFLRQSMPDGGAVYSNHLWPVAAYYSKRPTIVLWPRDARFYRVFPKNMSENGYFIYYRGVGKQPEEDWMDQRPEFHRLKDFGSTVLYAYKYSGQATITAEVRQRIDDAKTQFDAQAYEKVLDILAPVHFPDLEVANLRGWSYYRIGLIDQAAGAFREGLQAEADNPRNLIGLGYAELRLGDPQSARQHFRTALNQVPDAVDAMVGLGLASMRLGDNVAAEEQFRNALRLDPKNEEIRGYLSRAQAP